MTKIWAYNCSYQNTKAYCEGKTNESILFKCGFAEADHTADYRPVSAGVCRTCRFYHGGQRRRGCRVRCILDRYGYGIDHQQFFTALATGGAVIAGQFIGKKKAEHACLATNQLLSFTLKASCIIMVLGYLGKNLIINGVFGRIEADVMYNCNVYLLIVFASVP